MEPELDLVFLWHMHQPDYRAPGSGNYAMPWVYLHAMKDYADMVSHLERHPRVRAVVNFVPILLDQIDDYVAQLNSGQLRDPLLQLLTHPRPDELSREQRRLAVEACFRANRQLMVDPFPAYKRLFDLHQLVLGHGDSALAYLSGQYFADLVTWYHLAWTGETVRRDNPLVAALMSRGVDFSLDDRLALVEVIRNTLANLIQRYRALAARGQIEISATPYAHPLAPLLLDFHSARDAMPDAPLPQAPAYPGGRDRVDAHLKRALASHSERFGAPPVGIWPAEGAVSGALLQRLAAHGCKWAATGEAVLANSCGGYQQNRDLYRPHRLAAVPEIVMFFRNDRLSDLIGFEYARWHGKDAVSHFAAELDGVRHAAREHGRPLVCVILDGENAWEFYPYNAYYFFEDLYSLLEDHPWIRTTTFADCLTDEEHRGRTAELHKLTAGSWVYGTLATWIGAAEKNDAWDLLSTAKQSYDMVMGSDRLDTAGRAAATAQLSVCESSDWFWWLGDYNPADAVTQFDQLFRRNLRHLYQLLQLPPPDSLDLPLSRGGGDAEGGGTMRRSS